MSNFLKTATKRALRAGGFELKRIPPAAPPGSPPATPYLENPPDTVGNLKSKLKRQAEGGPFEWPNIIVLNKTVATLIGPARRIVELGGGTGCFAWEAGANPEVSIVSSEICVDASRYAAEHRSRPNIRYVAGPLDPSEGPFDLLVCIEVIEHVAEYGEFLKICAQLAPKAIITTPNKVRTDRAAAAEPPENPQHVREWTAGEFYWVLRVFYRRVQLLAMPDELQIGVRPIRITERLTPLIAICEEPY